MEENLTPKLHKALSALLQRIRNYYYRFKGYKFHHSVILERNLNLDRLNPGGIMLAKILLSPLKSLF